MVSVRKDALPESFRYTDEGCRAAPRCLDCPLPQCLYERTYSGIGLADSLAARHERDTQIVELYAQGLTPVKIAHKVGVSSRTVHRVVQQGGPSEAVRKAVSDGACGDKPGRPVSEPRQPIYKARQPLPRLQVAR